MKRNRRGFESSSKHVALYASCAQLQASQLKKINEQGKRNKKRQQFEVKQGRDHYGSRVPRICVFIEVNRVTGVPEHVFC